MKVYDWKRVLADAIILSKHIHSIYLEMYMLRWWKLLFWLVLWLSVSFMRTLHVRKVFDSSGHLIPCIFLERSWYLLNLCQRREQNRDMLNVKNFTNHFVHPACLCEGYFSFWGSLTEVKCGLFFPVDYHLTELDSQCLEKVLVLIKLGLVCYT